MTDAEMDEIRERAQSGNRIFRSATILKLLEEIKRWKATPAPPRCECGREMSARVEWVCPKCGEDWDD